MSYLTDLGWWVPEGVWEEYLDHIEEEWDDTTLYAGVFASSAMREYMDSDGFADTEEAILSDLPTEDSPHTKKKKESETPLSEKAKCKVRKGVHPPTKEAFASYARSNGENPGVMLAYALREYMNGGRLGRIEEIRSREQEDEAETEPEVPYSESEKAGWIADRLRERMDADGRDQIHAEEIREVVDRARAGSRFDHYRDAALDKLGFVHHPDIDGAYISHRDLWNDHGLSIDDPAIYRKPVEALSREEKIEGIKAVLSTRGAVMPVGRIHSEIFDGHWSKSHIRDLVTTVAESEVATYKPTAGGTKVLRVEPCGYPPEPEQRSESDPEPDLEPADESSETEDDAAESEIESDADDQMDALMNAQPARTDGGRDVSE